MPELTQPHIIAHRGASLLAPENTLAAFDLAIQQGADGCECDVRLTADGTLIVLHDELVDATTDGHGPIGNYTADAARQLQVRQRGGIFVANEHLPLLTEVLTRLTPPQVSSNFILNVEIKQTGSGVLAAAVADELHQHQVEQFVLISSFDEVALRHLQQHYPHIRLALLYPPTLTASMVSGITRSTAFVRKAAALGCVAVHPMWRLVTPSLVTEAHALGLQVNVWTVDDPLQARRLAAFGVDGIITNDPAGLRATFTSDAL